MATAVLSEAPESIDSDVDKDSAAADFVFFFFFFGVFDTAAPASACACSMAATCGAPSSDDTAEVAASDWFADSEAAAAAAAATMNEPPRGDSCGVTSGVVSIDDVAFEAPPNPSSGAGSSEKDDRCEAGSDAGADMVDAAGSVNGNDDADADDDMDEMDCESGETSGDDKTRDLAFCEGGDAGCGTIDVYHVCGRTLDGRTPTSVR